MQANVVISAYLPHPANSTFIPVSALDRTGCVAITPTLAFPASLPNFSCHYAVGDVASWTGMKRVGNSIAMGSIVGHNIYQSILRSEDLDPESGKRPLLEFPKVDPMMGLVIGKYCVSYYKEGGLEHGAETLDKYFSDDLSLKGCWDAIGLDVFA